MSYYLRRGQSIYGSHNFRLGVFSTSLVSRHGGLGLECSHIDRRVLRTDISSLPQPPEPGHSYVTLYFTLMTLEAKDRGSSPHIDTCSPRGSARLLPLPAHVHTSLGSTSAYMIKESAGSDTLPKEERMSVGRELITRRPGPVFSVLRSKSQVVRRPGDTAVMASLMRRIAKSAGGTGTT